MITAELLSVLSIYIIKPRAIKGLESVPSQEAVQS